MGKWLGVFRERLPFYSRQHEVLLGEAWPHYLIRASGYLPDEARELFPLLHRVRVGSEWYLGEDLWMFYLDVEWLLDDLRRLRRVCRFEEFIPGVDAQLFYERCRQDLEPDEFEQHLDHLESLLELTMREKCWLRISL